MYTEGQTISDLDARYIEGKILNFIEYDKNSTIAFSQVLFSTSTTLGVSKFMDSIIKKYADQITINWFFNPDWDDLYLTLSKKGEKEREQ